jgi:hypothetical protein
VTRIDAARLSRMDETATWLENAMGRLEDGRFESRPCHGVSSETTWSLRSRDGGFAGYAQLSVSDDGVVTVLLRDTSSTPPRDDVALIEPKRRDGSNAVGDPRSHIEVRRAVDRWIRYMRSAVVVDEDFDRCRTADAGRAGLLRTKPLGGGACAAFVHPPTAHHRMAVNEDPTAFDDEPHVEAAIDSRWSDVVEIGTASSSGRTSWTIVAPQSSVVVGDPDAMERLRIHREIIRTGTPTG